MKTQCFLLVYFFLLSKRTNQTWRVHTSFAEITVEKELGKMILQVQNSFPTFNIHSSKRKCKRLSLVFRKKKAVIVNPLRHLLFYPSPHDSTSPPIHFSSCSLHTSNIGNRKITDHALFVCAASNQEAAFDGAFHAVSESANPGMSQMKSAGDDPDGDVRTVTAIPILPN